MTREEIIAMAREAGLHSAVLLHLYAGKEAALTDSEHDELRRLERFAALVAKHEREACAKIVEPSADHRRNPEWYIGGEEAVELLIELAAAIRARGEKP